MRRVAADVLRAPSLLRRICAYHMHASIAPQDLPLRCWSIRLRDRRCFIAWFAAHGTDGLSSLCVPHLFAYAIACGDADVLNRLIDKELVTWTKELLVLDARGCQMCPRAIQDLGPAMKMRSRNIVARAAAKCQNRFLYRLRVLGLTSNDIWKAVCAGGEVDLAEHVIRTKSLDVWNDAYVNAAATSGYFELVRFLVRHRPSGINRETIALAIQHNQLRTLQDILVFGTSPNLLGEHALHEAVAHRRLDVLRWLCTRRDAHAYFQATRDMAIYYCAPTDIIQCLSNAWTQRVAMQRIRLVFQAKRLVTTIASYQNGVDGSTIAMNKRCKNLPIYRTTKYLSGAAEKGHLNVVRFLHEHDCGGFDKDTIALAMRSGNLELVQFLLTHRKESTLPKAMLAAADNDNLDVLRWLCDQPRASRYMEATMQQAETSASRKCIEYLATLPRTVKPSSDERPLKRKATVLL